MKKLIIILSALILLFGCNNKQEKKTDTVTSPSMNMLPIGSNRNSPVVQAVKEIDDSVVNIRT